MFSITTTSTGAQPDQQRDSENDDEDTSDRMQAESEEPSDLKVVKGTHDNVLRESFSTRRSSSGEGYIGDCSASEQASDQSVHCAASGQKQRSTMKLALNRLDLNFTSSEMESSSGQDGSSLTDEEMANTPMFDGIQARPQCKVARISHPMNPRIDISTVVHVQASVLALATTAASLPTATTMTVSNGATYTKGATGSTSITFVATASPTFDLPIMETYTQLLSPVRYCFYVLHFKVNGSCLISKMNESVESYRIQCITLFAHASPF
jgi:hypothetical protein